MEHHRIDRRGQGSRDRGQVCGEPAGPAAPTGGRRRTARALGMAGAYAARNRRSLGHLLRADLPSDVREEELTVAALFRASLVLNALTGGDPEMTFSARCHRDQERAAGPLSRLAWGVACLAIDLACAVLRGESEHCATAWENHCARVGVAACGPLAADRAPDSPLGPRLGASALTEI